MTEQEAAYRCLREYKNTLSRQQMKTLAGQIKAGQATAAMKGLNKLLGRREQSVGHQNMNTGEPKRGYR